VAEKQSQSEKFKQAARDLEARWEDKLREVVKPKGALKKPA
jgi:hypothetical protein